MHHTTDLELFQIECEKTNTFEELAALALMEMEKFTEGCDIVCGPISTGGVGSIEGNLKVFARTIDKLQETGHPIFTQLPYEEKIFSFRERWRAENPSRSEDYYMPILEEFYRPLFQSGKVKRAWFINGWESSKGARWERDELANLQVEVIDLGAGWVQSVLD
jgi:hypothetical protein